MPFALPYRLIDWHLPNFFDEEVLVIDPDRLLFGHEAVNHHDFETTPISIQTVFLEKGVVAHSDVEAPSEQLFRPLDVLADLLNIVTEVLDPVGHFAVLSSVRTRFCH